MTVLTSSLQLPIVPADVRTFADDKGLEACLPRIIDLARQAFPESAVQISLARDAEDEQHQYVAVDVDVSGKTVEELLAGQRTWSAGLSQVCPSRRAVYFVLGWQ